MLADLCESQFALGVFIISLDSLVLHSGANEMACPVGVLMACLLKCT